MAFHSAHYQVLTDNVVLHLPNLSPSGGTGETAENIKRQRKIWNPPNDIKIDGPGNSRPVLCFQVNPENANNFKLRVWRLTQSGAKKTILNWTFNNGQAMHFMEPFDTDGLHVGNNPIMFEDVSNNNSSGQLIIRNVMVMYQRFHP